MTPSPSTTPPVFDDVAPNLQSNPSSPFSSLLGSPLSDGDAIGLPGSMSDSSDESQHIQLAQGMLDRGSLQTHALQQEQSSDARPSPARPSARPREHARAPRRATPGTSLKFSPRPSFSLEDVVVKSRLVERDGQEVEETYSVIDGHEGSLYRYPDVRKMCTLLGVSGYKNRSKAVMLDLIVQSKVNNGQYNVVFQQKKSARDDPPRKQAQGPFRLLNILFSDLFAARLDALGDNRSRKELDGCISPEKAFWMDVMQAFLDSSVEAYGRVSFVDKNAVLRDMSVDPSIIVDHDWMNLQKMWSKLVADYEDPLRRFTNQIFKFCKGRVDLLYLHELLEVRPGLTAAVTRHLDKGVFYDSSHHGLANAPAPKRQRSELAEAIRELVHERAEAASGRAKQDVMREWCQVCDRLRDLCHKRGEETDSELLDEINAEIAILKGKRDELVKCL